MQDTQVYDDQKAGEVLLFARILDGRGSGREIGWDAARDWTPVPGEVLWMHVCRNADGIQNWLETSFGIPEPTAELLVSDDTRPRAFAEGETLVAVLRGINFNPDAQPEDMVSMQMWSDGSRLVTLRRHRLQTPRDTLALIDAGVGPADAGALITSLTEHMVARMSRSIIDMNAHIDELEEAGEDADPEKTLAKIAMIRRNCLALKRHMSPQHEALERISREAPRWFEEHDRREIAETIERLGRYLADIDISKESAVVLQDDIRARSIASNEKATYMLTIVAGIFLPLGFVTGLLGINVGGMPGMQSPDAFWVVVGLCCAILLVQLFLFWRWRWL